MPFFSKFKNTDDSYNLCNYLELESYEPSETIFEEVLYKLFFFFSFEPPSKNDIGKAMYAILKGTVIIF